MRRVTYLVIRPFLFSVPLALIDLRGNNKVLVGRLYLSTASVLMAESVHPQSSSAVTCWESPDSVVIITGS